MPAEPLSSFVAFGLQAFLSASNLVHAALCEAFIAARADFADFLYAFHAAFVAARRVFASVCVHAALSDAWRVWSAVFIAGYCTSHAAIMALSRTSVAVCMHESAVALSAALFLFSCAAAGRAAKTTETAPNVTANLVSVFLWLSILSGDMRCNKKRSAAPLAWHAADFCWGFGFNFRIIASRCRVGVVRRGFRTMRGRFSRSGIALIGRKHRDSHLQTDPAEMNSSHPP